jgi:hypothetical protein
MGAILDQQQMVLPGETPDGIEVRKPHGQVDWQNGSSVIGDRFLDQAGVEAISRRGHIDENGNSFEFKHRARGTAVPQLRALKVHREIRQCCMQSNCPPLRCLLYLL